MADTSRIEERFRLDGKVAVVTGGSRGMGAAVATGFAMAGADVVIASRKLDNCEAVANEISEKTGRKTVAVEFTKSGCCTARRCGGCAERPRRADRRGAWLCRTRTGQARRP